MKTGNLIKTFFLLLPLLIFAGNWLYNRTQQSNSIGGGYYDTGLLFYLIYSILYFILFEIVMLCMGIRQNSWFLIAGGILLFIYIIFAAIKIH